MGTTHMHKIAGFAALVLTVSALPAHARSDPAYGLWLTENARAIIEITPCDEKACGRIVWMDEPQMPDGSPKIDQNNPDEALQSRRLCGIPLVGGFAREEDGIWRGGYVYNPRDGKTYDAEIKPNGGDTLTLRGFVLVPAFGKDQTWTRVPDARGGC